MAMMPGLQLNMGQQLKLTPQLQQSIKILQYSALEVQQTIATTLETNFMLEADDHLSEASLENLEPEDTNEDQEIDLNQSDQIEPDLRVDCDWQEVYTDMPVATRSPSLDEYTPAENYTAAELSLTEKLYWQADIYAWSDPKAHVIAHYLIDEIDEAGYLKTALSDVLVAIKANEPDIHPISIDDLKQVLAVIWQFEPAGVGARDLPECLLLQLSQCPNSPHVVTAQKIITDHFDLLSRRDDKRLKKIYWLEDSDLAQIIEIIQSLSPRPGRAYAPIQNEIVVPDLRLHRTASGFMVELNQEAFPRLNINRAYIDMVNDLGQQSGDAKQIKEQLFEAKNLIKSIHSRGETLLRVGQYIVEKQAQFFEEGEQAMQPMVLRDLAEALDLHESTISRATNQKYMQTPRGTFELKYFFSSGVSQYGSDDQSAIAIKSHIKQMIDNEDPKKPLSDNKLMQHLEEKDIAIARRTIAKYREAMHIPSSSERKRMNAYR